MILQHFLKYKNAVLSLCFIVFSFIGCEGMDILSSQMPKQDITQNSPSEPFGIPEPFIGNKKTKQIPFNIISSTLTGAEGREIPLKGMMDHLEGSFFHIDDSISFENQKQKDLSQVKFKIDSTCMESENQKQFRKHIEMNYKKQIYLIELMPEEIFTYGKRWWDSTEINHPSCSFRFQAQNEKGDIHYFELPHFIFKSFEKNVNMSLIENNPKVSSTKVFDTELINQFPIFNFNQIRERNYSIITSYTEPINEIKLMCQHFQISFPVFPSNDHELWKLTGWNAISQVNKITQPCRFIGLYQNEVKSISQLFPIVFPLSKTELLLHISHSDARKKSQTSFHNNKVRSMIRHLYRAEDLDDYQNVAFIEIENKSAQDAHLLIDQTSLRVDYSALYNMETLGGRPFQEGFFIRKERGADLYIQDTYFNNKNPRKKHLMLVDPDDEKALVTVQAQSSIRIPVSLSFSNSCSFDDVVTGVGVILEGKHPDIYQVLNPSHFSLAQNTIVDRIRWKEERPNKNKSLYIDFYEYDEEYPRKQYFYANTCKYAGRRRWNTLELSKTKYSWQVSSRPSKSYKDGGYLVFRKKSEHLPGIIRSGSYSTSMIAKSK